MIFISILVMIVAMALPSTSLQQSPVLISRTIVISLIYAGVLVFNTLDIQSIGSSIGIYNGLFQFSFVSIIDTFNLIISAMVYYYDLLANNSNVYIDTVKDLVYHGAANLIFISAFKNKFYYIL